MVHLALQQRPERLTAADAVTASRFALTAGLALAAGTGAPPWVLGVLAGTALLTDLADGRLARATGTETRLGARLDAEADAVLILVLSAIASGDLGRWVLGIGIARYLFGALFAIVPALRTAPGRPRPWCRTVAASTGVTLAAVVALPVPGPLAQVAVAVVAALLAESFLHEAVDRWRAPRPGFTVPARTVLALLLVWVAMIAPAAREGLSAHALVRVPAEIVVLVLIAAVPARRARTGLAALGGLLLATLLLLSALDLGFHVYLDRAFDPISDWSYFGFGVGVLADSIGHGPAVAVAALGCLVSLALLLTIPAAVLRLVGAVRSRQRPSVRAASVLAATWGVCLAVGVPLVSSNAAGLVVTEVNLIRADVTDTHVFATQIADDPYAARAATDPAGLLTGLAGKDVLVVFVESYGRVAVQGTTFSPAIDSVLDQGSAALDAAGYSERSAFLTSPTFGGLSWLAHSTLESGLWVKNQRRYGQLLDSNRMTLTSLFGAAGWHTVFDVPADTEPWPQGQDFYRFAQYADSRNVGYRGPKFGYAPIPDQFTLEQFRRTQLAPRGRKPVMAEIDLVSSHHPWTPLPRIVPEDQIGDGSAYGAMPQRPTYAQVFSDPARIKKQYGESVQYTWRALTGFLTDHPDPNLVLVVLGDHQPHSTVSGNDPGHDVPISVISQDPAVVQRISGWGWDPGLLPSPDASVWPMSSFRDRFLAAFSH
ncbi:MAG: CDP-alcohol phosphatidyltransferase family protein [Marmoricola sp.]